MAERVGLMAERVGLIAERVGLIAERVGLMAERVGRMAERVGRMAERVGLVGGGMCPIDRGTLVGATLLRRMETAVESVFEGGRTVLRRFGERLGAAARPGDVIALVGTLGAGKTFLAQAIARGAGVPPSVRVTSPTFNLVQEHPGRITVHHADVYRLGSARELDELGLFERGAEGLVVVEWADRFPEGVPEGALWLTLELVSVSIRRVHALGHGARVVQLMAASGK